MNKKKLPFIKEFYLGDSLSWNRKQITSMLSNNQYEKTWYLITLASNPANQYEMIKGKQLSLGIVWEHLPLIVGIASNRQEAIELVIKLIKDVYHHTGMYHPQNYFLWEEEVC